MLLSGDLLVFFVSIQLGYLLDNRVNWLNILFFDEGLPLFFLGLVYIMVLYIGDFYNYYLDFRRRENVGQLMLWTMAGALLAILILSFPSSKYLPIRFLEWQAAGFIWLLIIWRYLFSAFALPMRLKRRLIIVGGGGAGRHILEAIRRRPNCGFEPVGFVVDDPTKRGEHIDGLPVLGKTNALESLISQHNVKLVVVARVQKKSPDLRICIIHLNLYDCRILEMPAFYEFLTRKVPVDFVGDAWLFFNDLAKQRLYYSHFKRLMDIGLAALGILFVTPFLLIVALAIKLDSRGPVFFLQDRLGKDGKSFRIVKFRTMIDKAESFGPAWAALQDSRITRVGRILRRFRIDELPQLLNILKGDMSFIGPRPEREFFIRQFAEQLPFYVFRLFVRPGITGWAQVMYHYTASLKETKEKLQYDLYYIKNMGFLLDLMIFLKTIRIVVIGRGR